MSPANVPWPIRFGLKSRAEAPIMKAPANHAGKGDDFHGQLVRPPFRRCGLWQRHHRTRRGVRRRAAPLHAFRLQLYGERRAAHRHRRAAVRVERPRLPDPRWPGHPQICHHVRAAGVRDGPELRHQPAVDGDRAGALLGLCRGDGPVALVDLPGLYRHVDRADLLRDRCRLCGPQPVGLHHQEGSVGLRHLSDHGRRWPAGGQPHQPVPALQRDGSGDQLPGRAALRGPHRL